MAKISKLIENELKFPDVKLGDNNKDVRRLQEWLTLNGHICVVDGDFGPITQANLTAALQDDNGFDESHCNDYCEGFWKDLTSDMLGFSHIDFPLEPNPVTLRALVIQFLHFVHTYNAQEVGGQNRGPWVRIFMQGQDGEVDKWCAGFCTSIINYAAEKLNITSPYNIEFSVENLLNTHIKQVIQKDSLKPGDIFCLFDPKHNHHYHTGFVKEVFDDHFTTCEGNSNESGSSEGYKVISKRRSFNNVDFLSLESV